MEKLPALAREGTHDGRRIERSVVQVDEIDAPLPRGRIVKPQRLRLDMKLFVGAGNFKLFEVRIAIEELVVIGDAVVLIPDIGIVEAIRQAADVRFPVADEEVKVVGTVALGEKRWIVGGLSVELDCEHRAENEP